MDQTTFRIDNHSTGDANPQRPRVLLISLASFTAMGFGMNFIMSRLIQAVNNKGAEATGILVSDDEESDTRLKDILDIKFDIINFGPLVRNTGAWGERVWGYIKDSKSNDAIMSLPDLPEESLVHLDKAIQQFRGEEL